MVLQIKQRISSGEDIKLSKPSTRVTTILVTNCAMFRGDLESFAEDEKIRLLVFNPAWQQALVDAFYGEEVGALEYYKASEIQSVANAQKFARRFLESVLLQINASLSVDLLLSPNMRFVEDLDWSVVSVKLGVPSVVLYTEGLNLYKRACEGLLVRQRKFGKFLGSHIIVANSSSKEIMVESGFVREEDISVGGMPRMDRLCRLINEENESALVPGDRNTLPQKRLLVLYFSPGRYQLGFTDNDGVWRPAGIPEGLYTSVMTSIIMLALKNQDMHILIKPKKGDASINRLYDVVDSLNIEIGELDNVTIRDDIDIHDAIMSSQVVCGLQSTVVLEASLANREVILPYFDRYHSSDWSDRFHYKDHLCAFTVAKDPAHLETSIIDGFVKNSQRPEVTKYRRELFQKWVSSPDGNATETCLRTMGLLFSNEKQSLYERPFLEIE